MKEEMTNTSGRRLMLHHWYLDDICFDDKTVIAHGIVTGHTRLQDSCMIHTSEVKKVVVNYERKEAEIHTRNSIYYCPFEYCDFQKQDKFPHIIANYEEIKNNYEGKKKCPTIEAGKVLLIISNFSEYYFESLYYLPEGESEAAEYCAYPHIGTFQDSYLIRTENNHVDLRYFPHFENIEFYIEHTNGLPMFIENIGDSVLYAKCSCGILRLEPGERKEVLKENTEKDDILLPGGDLYPALYL